MSLIPSTSAAQHYKVVFLPMPTGYTITQTIRMRDGQIAAVVRTNDPLTPLGRTILWTGSFQTYIDMGADIAIFGVGGGQQVGSGTDPMLWTGSPGSAIDLIPASLSTKLSGGRAFATDGVHQVGMAARIDASTGLYHNHALLWNSTADSLVDLQPSGYANSYALGVRNGQQVGEMGDWLADPLQVATMDDGRAVFWSGTADSAISLHPIGFLSSAANATDGSIQVGWGRPQMGGQWEHALRWTSSAVSVVDLNPSYPFAGGDCFLSRAYDLCGGFEVGFGSVSYLTDMKIYTHALAWMGSSASVIDLNRYLPAPYIEAEAYAIDTNGTIAGIARDAAGNAPAVLWVRQLDPTLVYVNSAAGIIGQTVSLVASLRASTGALTARSLTFTYKGTAIGTATTDGSGVARLSYIIPEDAGAGTRAITVSFAGDLDYKPASRALTLTVARAASVTYANNAAGAVGQNVTLAASLWTGSNRLPNRTLSFTAGGDTIGSATTDSNGVAHLVYRIPALNGAGVRTITASFAGDAAYTASQRNLTLTVGKGDTQVYTNSARASVRQSVALVASLWCNGERVPGKTLTYSDGVNVLGTAVTDANGIARLSYMIPVGTASGNHVLTVAFAGDATYNSSSRPLTLTVN